MLNPINLKNGVFYHNRFEDVLSSVSDKSVEMVLTDIPYGVVNRKSEGLRNFDKSVADVDNFDLYHMMNELIRVCVGSMYIFCSTEQVSEIRRHLSVNLTTRLCIWEKPIPRRLMDNTCG